MKNQKKTAKEVIIDLLNDPELYDDEEIEQYLQGRGIDFSEVKHKIKDLIKEKRDNFIRKKRSGYRNKEDIRWKKDRNRGEKL